MTRAFSTSRQGCNSGSLAEFFNQFRLGAIGPGRPRVQVASALRRRRPELLSAPHVRVQAGTTGFQPWGRGVKFRQPMWRSRCAANAGAACHARHLAMKSKNHKMPSSCRQPDLPACLAWCARAAPVEALPVSDACAGVRLVRITGASSILSRIILPEIS